MALSLISFLFFAHFICHGFTEKLAAAVKTCCVSLCYVFVLTKWSSYHREVKHLAHQHDKVLVFQCRVHDVLIQCCHQTSQAQCVVTFNSCFVFPPEAGFLGPHLTKLID